MIKLHSLDELLEFKSIVDRTRTFGGGHFPRYGNKRLARKFLADKDANFGVWESGIRRVSKGMPRKVGSKPPSRQQIKRAKRIMNDIDRKRGQ